MTRELLTRKAKGFTLVFDVVRRFAQPLGIELPKWEGRVIETKKGVVRLLPIAERAKQLFGEDGAQAVAARLEQKGCRSQPTSRGCCSPSCGDPEDRGEERSTAGTRASRFRMKSGRRPRGDDARPCPRGDAAPGRRAHQRAARTAQGRAGARPRFPAARQCLLGALPKGERREATDRRDALGGAAIAGCSISRTDRT